MVRLSAALPIVCASFLGADGADNGNPVGEEVGVPDAKTEFFEKKIRPVLASHCYSCHSAETKPAGDLRVDDYNGLLTGGNGGPAIVPGDPTKGTLLNRIRHEDPKRKMPKEGEALTDSQIADFAAWIQDGAAWPKPRLPSYLTRVRSDYAELKATHWAWQPLTNPGVPATDASTWPWTAIDRFVLAKLKDKKLSPVADADPLTLLRRVTYDLTGLPPTPSEIAGFRKNPSGDAFERVVDRLLASSAYAERWGRHWLDVARYGESTGPSRNIPYPHAWKYRDYVLDAVGRDIPFDRFVQEQIAGDLLPASDPAERDRLLTATGFLALGVKDVNQRFKVRFQMDNVDEQVDAVSRAFVGVTVSCARCHDHKFDPIPTADYYALAGIFTSTDNAAGVRNKMGGGGLDYYDPAMLVRLDASKVPAPPAEKVEELTLKVAEAKKEWDAIRGTPEGLALGTNGVPRQRSFRLKYDKVQAELLELTDPVNRGYAVHGVRDAKVVGDTEIRIRGEAERLGPKVPRGFPNLFEVPGAPSVSTNQSGRLELAQWLTHPKNPLTARVAVNRVWQQLFGEGIVNTVDNFGVKGDRPSNPELLDHLAGEFIRDQWSVKRLIRRIVVSHAYRLGFDAPAEHREADPANRLVWRHSPRRLTAEEIRDSILLTSGRLQPRPEGGSPARELKMIEMGDTGAEARTIREKADQSLHRSVYLPLLRGVVPRTLEPFDPVEQTLVTAKRDATTVPTQALYFLNSGFVRKQSLAFADRLLSEPAKSDRQRIRRAYRLTLGRPPTPAEITHAEQFLGAFETTYVRVTAKEPGAQARLEPGKEPTVPAGKAGAGSEAKPVEVVPAVPVNPDDMPRPVEVVTEEAIQPGTPKAAAWSSWIQALYASAEFRFVR